jgi:hypothetical protein
MTTPPAAGDSVLVEVDGYYVNPLYANNTAYTVNAGISGTANTIQLAIDGIVSAFAPKASPSLTGFPIAPTATSGTSNTHIATTAYVNNLANSGSTLSHSITGNAGTVTNGVYTDGTYNNPSWITGLAGSKVSSIPNSSLTNSSVTINGTAISLGASVTVTAAAGTLSGSTLASDITASSLTSVGTLGSLTVTNTITGSVSGNAGTVTNGVYTVGAQTIQGIKTFESTIIGSISGSAARVSNGVYTNENATLNGVYTFTQNITGTISNATSATTATSATSATTAATASALNSANDYSLRNLTASGTGSFTGTLTSSSTISAGGNISASGSLSAGNGLSVTGAITATGDITAYFSDERLKTKLGGIENALEKVQQLSGFYYEANEIAQSLGYEAKREVGVSAQEVEKVMPEIVRPAPIDAKYLTIQYERLVPLLIEAIKELKSEVDVLKGKIK